MESGTYTEGSICFNKVR